MSQGFSYAQTNVPNTRARCQAVATACTENLTPQVQHFEDQAMAAHSSNFNSMYLMWQGDTPENEKKHQKKTKTSDAAWEEDHGMGEWLLQHTTDPDIQQAAAAGLQERVHGDVVEPSSPPMDGVIRTRFGTEIAFRFLDEARENGIPPGTPAPTAQYGDTDDDDDESYKSSPEESPDPPPPPPPPLPLTPQRICGLPSGSLRAASTESARSYPGKDTDEDDEEEKEEVKPLQVCDTCAPMLAPTLLLCVDRVRLAHVAGGWLAP